jgi:hypothetical protein
VGRGPGGPSRAEASRPEAGGREPGGPEAGGPEPGGPEPVRAEPVRAAPSLGPMHDPSAAPGGDGAGTGGDARAEVAGTLAGPFRAARLGALPDAARDPGEQRQPAGQGPAGLEPEPDGVPDPAPPDPADQRDDASDPPFFGLADEPDQAAGPPVADVAADEDEAAGPPILLIAPDRDGANVPRAGLTAEGAAAVSELRLPELSVRAIATDTGQLVVDWARGRSLGTSSVGGITITLAVCSAVWFSAGTRADNLRAVAALWASYLALLAARSVASLPEQQARTSASAIARSKWLAVLCWCLSECGIYAGLGAGAAAEHWPGAWTLTAAVLSLVVVRELMTTMTPHAGAEEQAGGVRRAADLFLTMPVGGRVLLIGIVAPVWGCRTALLALLDWGMIAIAYGIACQWPAASSASAEAIGKARLRLRDDGVLAGRLGQMVRGNLLPLPPALLGLAATAVLVNLGLRSLPTILIMTPALVMLLLAAPGSSNPHTGRLDGLVPAVLLGWQFLYIVAVGLAVRVPGPVTFALCAALLLRFADLACPSRPVVLMARQTSRGERLREPGTALGWEGRMLVIGAAAGAGIAMYAYVALTAYLVLLICAKIARTRQTGGPARDPAVVSRAGTAPDGRQGGDNS